MMAITISISSDPPLVKCTPWSKGLLLWVHLSCNLDKLGKVLALYRIWAAVQAIVLYCSDCTRLELKEYEYQLKIDFFFVILFFTLVDAKRN